jgi:hypothetical protein
MSVTRLTLIATHHVHNHSIAPTDALYATEPAGDGDAAASVVSLRALGLDDTDARPPVGQVSVWPYVDDGGRRANLGGRGIAAAAIRMVRVTTTDSPGSSAQGSSHARFARTAG